MMDHSVNKFFETLFWIGALLIFISFSYPRWFVITIFIGIVLMIMATIREGFKLKRSRTLVGIIRKNEPKIIHRIILLIGVILAFVYLLFKQTLIYNLLTQLYDLTQAIKITWVIFILLGIIIGVFLLFCGIKVGQVEYRKFLKWEELKSKKKLKKEVIIKKEIKEKKEEKLGFFTKLLLEEESFWKKIFKSFFKKLEEKKAKKLRAKTLRMEQLRKEKLEEIRKKAKGKTILLKKEIKHPLLPRLLITLFIFAMTAILILHRNGLFSIANPLSAGVLGMLIGLFLLYILINVYKIRKKKKLTEEKKEKGVLQKIKKEVVAKASKYETDIDKLYRLINEVGSLTITEVAEGFGISKEQAEEWGRILESHNLIDLNYPLVGELQLCKKKLKSTK